MRDGVETLFFVLCILFAPLIAFDLGLNQGRMWQKVLENTYIDEAFNSLLRLLA